MKLSLVIEANYPKPSIEASCNIREAISTVLDTLNLRIVPKSDGFSWEIIDKDGNNVGSAKIDTD